MRVDVLIVGQGIAGTVLGETLVQKGQKVRYIDQGHQKSSSIIAAGMYNPMGFKRVNKTWMIDDLLPFSQNFYQQLSEKLAQNFIRTYDILKFFATESYKEMWDKSAEHIEYISTSEITHSNELINNDFGYGRVVNCGRLELKRMLVQYRQHLIAHNNLQEEAFTKNLLDIEAGSYGDTQFNYLIFCQGHEGCENTYFNHLPLQKTKGELLRIKSRNLKSANLLNRGFFIVPVGNDQYDVGSTYNWADQTIKPTADGRDQILSKLRKLYKGTFEVVEHRAGLRPTVVDRRPLIGMHPVHNKLGIFNGLGSKGVLLAPFFANQFAEHLLQKRSLNPEVDINRFN